MHHYLGGGKRGTVLYVKKELNPKKVFSDTQGSFVAVEITYQNKKNTNS